jgi:hypothetical protein
MFAKKLLVTLTPPRGFQKELKYLYQRRSAVDTLIRSLEDYDRFREKALQGRKPKTA